VLSCSSILRPPPSSTLFPYTTLFRSPDVVEVDFLRVQASAGRLYVVFQLLAPFVRAVLLAHRDRPDASSDTPDDGIFRIETVRRSEEHTSELQSRENLVCRLLLEKKK